jgi:hypothetical protein
VVGTARRYPIGSGPPGAHAVVGLLDLPKGGALRIRYRVGEFQRFRIRNGGLCKVKRKEDPKRDRALFDREQAQARLNMCLVGIGEALKNCASCRFYEGEVNHTVDLIDSELKPALAAARKAEQECEPYRKRGRVRLHRVARPPKKKAA